MPNPLPFEPAPNFLPTDSDAVLVGRILDPTVGPCLAAVRGEVLVDLTPSGPTMSDLLERSDLRNVIRHTPSSREWRLDEVLSDTVSRSRDRPVLLAPIDLHVIKAAGVTFAASMMERVIEERAKGDPLAADEVRAKIVSAIGGTLNTVKPGSAAAAAAKALLIEAGMWSQYLEVGIGPDPEIFTKAPVLSSVGPGAEIGVLSRSSWNNPEPEVVLLVTSAGRIVGATLGNDVNLRDFEGRSALLLTEAKDNNASCAIGPFIRVFDDAFGLDDVRKLDIDVTVDGVDGFHLHETSSMAMMSRDIEDLVTHAFGPHHRYPDGFALFTGTLFAPTQDRDGVGLGFTHHATDVVRISSPRLGTLMNEVNTAEDAPDWTFGIRSLMSNLASRGLLKGAS